MEVSEEAVDAALSCIPCNDLLYGDTSKPVSRKEMKNALEAGLSTMRDREIEHLKARIKELEEKDECSNV